MMQFFLFKKIKQRRRQITEHKLQKVKDKNLLKNWRNMYRRRSYDAVRKSSNQSSGPVLPGNSVTNTAPFGVGKVLKLSNKSVILSLSRFLKPSKSGNKL